MLISKLNNLYEVTTDNVK